ncbi:MAG: acyl-CoA reductase [Bacteroidia bacterium]|nr:acyl-CoA reductase [Bacteroidia bacterium]
MNKEAIKEIFSKLGTALGRLSEDRDLLDLAEIHNRWFSPEQVIYCLKAWEQALQPDKIERWAETITQPSEFKNVGIIMAGNLPLVGLHDLLCVIASGHKASVKLSSQDEILMKKVISILIELDKNLENKIEYAERLNGIDALISTGSNNSSRYFEYYFRNIPKLIRKNRTSIAVLDGSETNEQLELLADDTYRYYGLGCRNVSHILIPRDFDLGRLIRAFDKYGNYINHNKYHNNYVYHKAILLMNLTKHLDTGFSIWQEKEDLHAPVSTMNYHFYDDPKEVENYISTHKESLQCIVGNNYLPFGISQLPELWDYADGIDTIEFLEDFKVS